MFFFSENLYIFVSDTLPVETIVTCFFFPQITGLKIIFKFFLLDVNFESLMVGLHIFYNLNIYIKFRSNQILFTIQLINLFVMHNFRL